MVHRRSLFKRLSLAGMLAAARTPSAAAARLARHRNLFTGDSCVYFYNPEIYHPEGTPFTAKAIHRYVDRLADSGIDTFLTNPNANVVWHPSKTLPTVLDGYKRGDREFFRGHAIAAHVPADRMDAYLDHQMKFFNLYLDLAEAGVDWVAETSKACRRRGISPWVSVRMNDTHGADNPEGSHFNAPIFKKKENRLSGVNPDPRDGVHPHWAGLNYDRPAVRDFMMSVIREYVERYDFEGLELDWLRDPHCLEPGASQRQIDTITAWLGDVRALTERRAKQLGKPYPLGLRIPGTLGYLKSRGIDVKAIVQAGHVDFLGFSNFWQTSWDMPYDELRQELGPGVVFYGVVEDAPNWVSGYSPELAQRPPDLLGASYPHLGIRYMAASRPMQHANAAGKLAMGVHGIEQFNFFCTDQPKVPGLRADYDALRITHDLKALRGQDKHYCLSTPSGRASMMFELPEQLPAVIAPKQRREFRLSMCSEPPDRRLLVQVVYEKRPAAPRLGLSFNGSWPTFESAPAQEMLFPVGPYTQHLPEHAALRFTCSARDIREGWNRVLVLNNDREPVTIVSVELGVKS